MNLLHV